MKKIFLLIIGLTLSSCSSISLRKTNYTEKWSKTLAQQLADANPGYNFTVIEGPTDTVYFEGISGVTFTGSHNYNRFILDYDFYFESYNSQFISYSYTGPINSGYSTQVTPTASGLQIDIGYLVFSFLKPYIGIRSHTMNYGGSIAYKGNGISYIEIYENKKYVALGIEMYYRFTNSLGLVFSPEYSIALNNKSPTTSTRLVTISGGLKWDLDDYK